MAVTVGVVPEKLTLAQNYPNPFNPSTTIEFVVPQSGHTTMKVYNILGQEVATLFEGNAEVGRINGARFDASNLPSGLYFYTLRSVGSGNEEARRAQVIHIEMGSKRPGLRLEPGLFILKKPSLVVDQLEGLLSCLHSSQGQSPRRYSHE
jgi:hypothetical protein